MWTFSCTNPLNCWLELKSVRLSKDLHIHPFEGFIKKVTHGRKAGLLLSLVSITKIPPGKVQYNWQQTQQITLTQDIKTIKLYHSQTSKHFSIQVYILYLDIFTFLGNNRDTSSHLLKLTNTIISKLKQIQCKGCKSKTIFCKTEDHGPHLSTLRRKCSIFVPTNEI